MGRGLRTAAGIAAVALVLVSCSGEEETPTEEVSESPSPSPSSTVAVPDGVELTEPGTDLEFGETATVIYEPDQQTGTVLRLTVERAVQGTLKDFSRFVLDDYTKSSTPYYVDVSVENVGESRVGDAPVPLWGVDGTNTLLPPASFTTSFQRCESKPLPKRFAPGDSLDTCLVYLAPDKGTLEAVSFRPNQQFHPIQWTGEIATPEPERDRDKDRDRDNKRDRDDNG